MLRPAPRRVRQPTNYPEERLPPGEMHLLRSRLDELLAAAVAATPPLPPSAPSAGTFRWDGCA